MNGSALVRFLGHCLTAVLGSQAMTMGSDKDIFLAAQVIPEEGADMNGCRPQAGPTPRLQGPGPSDSLEVSSFNLFCITRVLEFGCKQQSPSLADLCRH